MDGYRLFLWQTWNNNNIEHGDNESDRGIVGLRPYLLAAGIELGPLGLTLMRELLTLSEYMPYLYSPLHLNTAPESPHRRSPAVRDRVNYLFEQGLKPHIEWRLGKDPYPKYYRSLTDLRGVVAIENHSVKDDEGKIWSNSSAKFNSDMQAEANWITTTTEFCEWKNGQAPLILLADGCPSKHNASMLLMPTVCAQVAGVLGLCDPGFEKYVLLFFAKNYCNTEESVCNENGPKALIRSLITQLIDCIPKGSWKKRGIACLTSALPDAIQRYDLGFLCRVFDEIVDIIDPGVKFYCIIEGISLWEQEPWIDDLELVVSMFEHILKRQRENPGKSATLRVLMGSPGKSTKLVEKTKNRAEGGIWKHLSLDSYTSGSSTPKSGTFLSLWEIPKHRKVSELEAGWSLDLLKR
ncbi:hypothetical protein GGR51DRAFT_562459 [Nemania sp. FL0031]|nr:hypothetical protein GGR51DRAFT_562459 [Nemania sp. FL0031]